MIVHIQAANASIFDSCKNEFWTVGIKHADKSYYQYINTPMMSCSVLVIRSIDDTVDIQVEKNCPNILFRLVSVTGITNPYVTVCDLEVVIECQECRHKHTITNPHYFLESCQHTQYITIPDVRDQIS